MSLPSDTSCSRKHPAHTAQPKLKDYVCPQPYTLAKHEHKGPHHQLLWTSCWGSPPISTENWEPGSLLWLFQLLNTALLPLILKSQELLKTSNQQHSNGIQMVMWDDFFSSFHNLVPACRHYSIKNCSLSFYFCGTYSTAQLFLLLTDKVWEKILHWCWKSARLLPRDLGICLYQQSYCLVLSSYSKRYFLGSWFPVK